MAPQSHSTRGRGREGEREREREEDFMKPGGVASHQIMPKKSHQYVWHGWRRLFITPNNGHEQDILYEDDVGFALMRIAGMTPTNSRNTAETYRRQDKTRQDKTRLHKTAQD
jgi:hypothetical protein